MTEHEIAALAQRVHDAERMDWGARSTRDSRNRDWARIAGVVYHGHPVYNPTPDPRWHLKDAGGGRPQSDDVLAFRDTRMMIDFIGGAGADGYTIRAGHWEGPLGPEQNIYAPPVPDGGGAVAPPAAPLWSPAHATLIGALLERQTPNQAGDEAFVRMVAEQFAHSFPAEGWGMKRVDPTRPLSNNVVARQTTTGLVGFRVVPAATLPPQIDLRGQVFDAVTARNHLDVVIAPPPPVDPPIVVTPPPASACACDARLDAIDDAVLAVGVALGGIEERILAAVRKKRVYDIIQAVGCVPVVGTATSQEEK